MDYINVDNKRFPLRHIILEKEHGGYTIAVSTVALENVLLDTNGERARNKAYTHIDDMIAYYASEEEFQLSDRELSRRIYG